MEAVFVGFMVCALLGIFVHQYMNETVRKKEVEDLKEQVDALKRMYEEASSQQKATHVEESLDQNVNYTQEVLTLIENFHTEINLRRNSSLMNQSDAFVEVKLMQDEFQKQLKITEEKINFVETGTRKAIETVESAVGKLSDSANSDFEEFRELFDALNMTVLKNQEMNENLMKHIEELGDVTNMLRSRMSTFESDLESVRNGLDSLGIDFTSRVLPNLFNKGSALAAFIIVFLAICGWNYHMYNKYLALSQSFDKMRQEYSSVSYGGVSGRIPDQQN